MKFLIAVLVAVVAFDSAAVAASVDKTPSLQVTAAEVAKAVKTVTTIVTKYDTIINDFLLEASENVTQIEDASVNLQTGIVLGLANMTFTAINKFKENAEANMTSDQAKLLDCVVAEETLITDTLEDAFTKNAWCNSELPGNLTSALQKVTAAVLTVSTELDKHAESLSSCILGDEICLALFSAEVAAMYETQKAGGEGTVIAGLKDVISALKVIIEETVPQCAEDILFPALKSGFTTIYSDVETCVKA